MRCGLLQPFSLLSALLLLLLQLAGQSVHAWIPEESPNYCSTNMTLRRPPPLSAEDAALNPSLKQVQAVIRHGARTPYMYYAPYCWTDYDVSWNCNVTELMLASPEKTGNDRSAQWLFRKLYDGSPNYYGGTCMTGQLIGQGYRQETGNGENWKEAYIGPNARVAELFDTDDYTELENQLYLRSDDEQRTLESGQIAMHAFLNVSEELIVPWHTGDYSNDQIYPNYNTCPRLAYIQDQAYASDYWQNFNNSDEVVENTEKLLDILGPMAEYDYMLDCFFTTVCTHRDLPDGMNQTLFDYAINYTSYMYAFAATWNDSAFSKLALGHTAYEIRERVNASVLNKTDNNYKFVLYSAHDTTVMPLLGIFGIWGQVDLEWAPYASSIMIELYDTDEGDMVRIVYNGQVMALPNCSAALCPVDKFFAVTAYAEDFQPLCDVVPDESTTSIDDDDTNDKDDGGSTKCSDDDDDDDSLSTGPWIGVTLAALVLGIFLGGGAAIYGMRNRKATDGSALLDEAA